MHYQLLHFVFALHRPVLHISRKTYSLAGVKYLANRGYSLSLYPVSHPLTHTTHTRARAFVYLFVFIYFNNTESVSYTHLFLPWIAFIQNRKKEKN